MRRRLFQCFQQRIERRLGKHVHLIDQVHLEATARRRVLRVLDHFAHVVHTGVAGGIDLEQIRETAFIHRRAYGADTARIGRFAALAIQRLGENTRDGGLAHAARTGEEVSVMHATGRERVGERTHHVFLPHQLGELARAPFAREYLIAHGGIPWGDRGLCQGGGLKSAAAKPYPEKGGGPASHTPAPESFATVASFRTWRSLRTIVAGGPTGPP